MFESRKSDIPKKYTTDDNYETEAFEISDELQDQIQELQQSVHLTYLIDYLQKLHEASRKIQQAFIKVIAEDTAKSYYITGKRGKPKRVKLDRELVVYD